MTLLNAELGKEYMIRSIETDDDEMDSFLFTLGCYAGEPITVISRRRGTCVVSIKDGRYTVGDELAECIKLY
ncbi:MAG: ferrous iron transport protein A [Ruminococcaceae bacterium]|nr:ferrous iron transport protein A [Oscillospiraceae bacterium]